MNSISRRDALRSAGLFWTAPMVGAMMPRTAHSQAPTVTPLSNSQNETYPAFSRDLGQWVHDNVCRVYAKTATGTATFGDLKDTSSKLHMLARHISDTKADDVFKYYAKKYKISMSDLSLDSSSETAYQDISLYDPSISRKDVAKHFITSNEEIANVQGVLASAGLSGIIHRHADVLGNYANLFQINNSQRTSSFHSNSPFNGQDFQAVNALYRPHHNSLLVDVSLGSTCKNLVCKATSNSFAKYIISALVTSALQYAAYSAAGAICSADAAASIILDISTGGGAAIASPLEVALCASAVGTASTVAAYVAGTIGLGYAVDQAISTLATALGCPESGGDD